MPYVSLGTLLTNIENRADLPTLDDNTFIKRETMTEWVNQSARRLMGKLVAANAGGVARARQTIATVAGQDYTDLGTTAAAQDTDVFRVLAMRVTIDGVRVPIRRAGLEQLDAEDDNATSGWSAGRRLGYILTEAEGQRIYWTVTPQAVHSVTVHYVPYFLCYEITGSPPSPLHEMSDESDHGVNSFNGWDEWIELDCAIKALDWQGFPLEESADLRSRRDELSEEVMRAVQERVAEPMRVQKRWRRRRGRVLR